METQQVYGPAKSAQDAIHEKACALVTQAVAPERWAGELIEALDRAGYAVVPKELPHLVLGETALSGVFEIGNPKIGWDYLLAKVRAVRKHD